MYIRLAAQRESQSTAESKKRPKFGKFASQKLQNSDWSADLKLRYVGKRNEGDKTFTLSNPSESFAEHHENTQ